LDLQEDPSPLLAVELQPYGSKNLDGYRRAVVLPIKKNLRFGRPKCVADFD
jgi:hypothetical protein